MKRRFKKEIFTTSDTGEKFCIYKPTINVGGSTLVSDKFASKIRKKLGNYDSPFVIKARKGKC